MNDNPYAAPKSAVADAGDAEAPRTRPVQVVIAVALLAFSVLIGAYFIAVDWEYYLSLAPRAFPIFVVASIAFTLLLIVKMFEGRNWARIVYLVLICISVPRFVTDLPGFFAVDVGIATIVLVQAAAQVAAMVLVFAPPGHDWFRRARVRTVRRLFSYGSLQREDVQRALLGRTLHGLSDEIVGFELAKSRSGAHLNVVRSAHDGQRVQGTVFEVTDDDLTRADEYERRDGYERIEAVLASGANAWVYVEVPEAPGAQPA